MSEKKPADDLETLTFSPAGEGTQAAEPTPDPAEAEQLKIVEAGIQKLLIGVLKIARAAIAKRMPEILEEWTDPVLEGPAAAAVPLAKKHMGSIMERLGQNPELAVFALSMVPLAMGYMSAMDKHQRTVDTVEPAQEIHAAPAD